MGFWVAGLETWREVLVILAFHLLGPALEIFKVHVGSWSYPEDAVTEVAGVPPLNRRPASVEESQVNLGSLNFLGNATPQKLRDPRFTWDPSSRGSGPSVVEDRQRGRPGARIAIAWPSSLPVFDD